MKIRPEVTRPFLIGVAAAVLSMALGLTVLAGWYGGNKLLIQVSPAFVPMQYNTALGFFLCGLGLAASLLRRERVGAAAGAVVALIGLATLLEYLFKVDLHLDQAFMEHYITVETSHPGRMAPNTALSFFLSGSALVASIAVSTVQMAERLEGILGALVLGLGTVAFAGYLTALETAYGWGNLTRMAVHTALGFGILGVGLMGLAWNRPTRSGKGTIPDWFAAAVAIGVATGTVALWQALHFGGPSETLGEQARHIAHHAVLVFGLVLAGFTALSVYFAQKSWERAQAAEQANAELRQFAHIASHDLQEPLRTVTTYLQLLEHRHAGKLDGDAREFIDYAVGASKRMSRLINDLLGFSRIQARTKSFELFPADRALRQAIDNLTVAIGESQANISSEGPLPIIYGDRTQVVSLFQNLIGNAIKFRDPKRRPEIQIRFEAAHREARFFVADNGIGIEPPYHDKVFEIFQRLHTQTKYDGTGIGLAVCKRIVERHGGVIELNSVLGEGTTVSFVLPTI